MDARVHHPTEQGIGDLVHQLVADGRNLVAAEVNLYKQIAAYRAGKAKNGIVAMAAGGLLLFAAFIAFMVGLMMEIAHLFDSSALGGLALLAVTGVIAFLLFRYGAGKMTALSGDSDEKAALRAGESRA